MTRNVAALTAGPRTERQEIPALDRDSALRIVHAVHSDRLEAVVTVALAVGLRQAAALGLRWDDLDLDARTLRVNQTIQRVDGELVSVPPKTAKSRRTIPLPSFAVLALRGHRTRQLEERLQAGEGWSDAGLVFTGARGQALNGPHVTRRFQWILAQSAASAAHAKQTTQGPQTTTLGRCPGCASTTFDTVRPVSCSPRACRYPPFRIFSVTAVFASQRIPTPTSPMS